MDIQKLKELLRQPEGAKLDFKEQMYFDTESRKKEFVKDICAIANSKGGRGYIIFGVKDKTKEIVGVEIEPFDEERIQQIICNRCDPPVPVRVETLDYLGKTVVVVTVFKSEQKPHQVRQTGAFYLRRGSTTDIAHRHEIANMLQEGGWVSYETVLLHRAPIEALSYETIREYLLPVMEVKEEALDILLEGLGIMGKDSERDDYHPTLGGAAFIWGRSSGIFAPYLHTHRVQGASLDDQRKYPQDDGTG